jgi:hypothetical protein
MILETSQMLSTAYQKHAGESDSLYKSAYPNHPMTLWVGETYKNFGWTLLLGEALGFQYTHRYNKRHKSMRIIDYFFKNLDWKDKIPKGEQTSPPLCMPDEFKCDDYVQAYKNYYINKKKSFAKYTKVDTPDFMC